MTSDAQILADIRGITIECTKIPVQHKLRGSSPDDPNFKDIDAAVHKLNRKEIVNVTDYVSGQIVSDIFPHPNNDGTYRLILNLREFNEIVEYRHFKMDSLLSVIRLMEPNCFMASIDIKDAYYSFAIKPGDRHLLCFTWQGKLYHFTCLPNGLSSAPRKFTKLCKVPLTYLHKQGHISLGHLDDFYLQGRTQEQCLANVIDTVALFTRLGLVVHPDKSSFLPSQIITLLGFILNSITMTVKLTEDKAANLQKACQTLLRNKNPTIREVARVIGKIVSSFPGTNYGPLYYRHLEHDKTIALKQNKGNFDGNMTLSTSAKSELTWWINSISTEQYNILHGQPTLQITTDASLLGWGAECEGVSTGGHWTPIEANKHINYLEMYAAFFGLQTFAKDKCHVHIRLRLDNTTGVSVLNHMGTSHSMDCNTFSAVKVTL